MRAMAVWTRERRSGAATLPDPKIEEPTQAILRVLEVGVCGTDTELCTYKYGDPPSGSNFLVTGHEALAVVEEVGDDVERLSPGDIVVPSVRRPCDEPECDACRAGAQDFCVTGKFTERGIRQRHGYLTERVVDEAKYFFRVPPIARDVAVLTEPLTIAEKALRQYAAIQRRLPWLREEEADAMLGGTKALVLGAGPVAVLGAMLLADRGCEVVVYSKGDPSSAKAALMAEIGATYVSSEAVDVATLRGGFGPFDVVYEAAGAPQFAFDCLSTMGPNGVFLLTGVSASKEVRFDGGAAMKEMVLANQVIAGTVNANADDFRSAIADLARFREVWPTAVHAVITGRHPMEEFCTLATKRPAESIKEVIVVSE